jgi:hypothetical protein
MSSFCFGRQTITQNFRDSLRSYSHAENRARNALEFGPLNFWFSLFLRFLPTCPLKFLTFSVKPIGPLHPLGDYKNYPPGCWYPVETPHLDGTCFISEQCSFPHFPSAQRDALDTWVATIKSLSKRSSGNLHLTVSGKYAVIAKTYACQAQAESKNMLCGCHLQGHLDLNVVIAMVPAPGGLVQSTLCRPCPPASSQK